MQTAVYMRYVRVEGMQWCYSGSNGMVWYGMVWYAMVCNGVIWQWKPGSAAISAGLKCSQGKYLPFAELRESGLHEPHPTLPLHTFKLETRPQNSKSKGQS